MSKEYPTIIIPCQGNPNMEKKEISFSRTDLHAPKKSWKRPYSNPNGEDNKSLQCHLKTEKGGDLPKDAYNLSFDFERDEAIFSFDPNKIHVREDKGLFEFELMGKYGFKEYVRIPWEKEKCSLINIVPHIGRTSYTLGKDDTSIGYIEVSPKILPCQPEIKVKISLDEALRNYLNIVDEFILQNGEAKKVNISLKKESIKHLPTRLINGKIIFRVDSTDGNVEPVEVAIGKANLLDDSKCENCVTLKEESHLSISNSNDDDELFDEENPLTVYVNQVPTQKDVKLNTTLIEATASIIVVPDRRGGKTLVSSEDFGKELQLKENHPEIVSISISPNEKAGTICQSLILSADYSLPCKKKVYVKTIEQEPPTGHLDFDYSSVDEDNNPNPYYKGNGKEKIGTLKVLNESLNNEQYRQVILPPTCTCPYVTIVPLEKSVKAVNAKETASYNVFIDIPESEAVETDEDDNLSLVFSCDKLSEITKTLPIKNKQPEDIQIRFTSEKDIEYVQEHKILVGRLEVQYVRRDSKYFINRDDRFLTLEDSGIILVADQRKKSRLTIKNGVYPVYYDCAVKFAGKKNIDENEYVILKLKYSDSIEKEREIPIEFEICPIKANPRPNVCVTCEEDDCVIWEDGDKKVEVWTYQFDSRARNNVHSDVIGHVCFFNKQNIPYKKSELLFKQVDSKGMYLCIETDSEISLPNGGEAKIYPIQIIYDNLPVSDDITTELSLKYEVCVNGETKSLEANIPIRIREIVVDDWYSLDLGTTGIVVAKWTADNPDETTSVRWQDDTRNAIEQESTIASSKTILMDKGEDEDDSSTAVCVVHPNKLDLKQKATFVLVPSKFFAGQTHVPFAKSYKERYFSGLTIGSNAVNWKVDPKLLLQHTYKTIFDMVGEDCRHGIRKLIVTYPNTYTPSSLTWLRDAIISEGNSVFPLLTSSNLHFIPESDAVVAFYINQQINGATAMENHERIVVYDMGAGTLDLSYVVIVTREGKRCATIQKRIGIPIAGDFLSYLLYKQIENKISANTSMHTTREFVETVKSKFSTNLTYENLNFKDSVFTNKETLNEKMEIGEELQGWIEICSDVIFRLLLGDKWCSNVDKVVFSGRGSQFAPLRDNIEKKIGTKEKLDETTISPDSLKQCVAKGALLYQRIFENENMPFSIVHKNTYQNIGFRYRVVNKEHVREWRYEELVGEKDYIWDETPINGAYHAVVDNKAMKELDFSDDANVTFYLTPLSKNEMKQLLQTPNDNKWCFVNQLFTFNPSFLASDKRKNVKISISIDKNNQLCIKLNDKIDLLRHTTAPNIEENHYFTLCYDYINKKQKKNGTKE